MIKLQVWRPARNIEDDDRSKLLESFRRRLQSVGPSLVCRRRRSNKRIRRFRRLPDRSKVVSGKIRQIRFRPLKWTIPCFHSMVITIFTLKYQKFLKVNNYKITQMSYVSALWGLIKLLLLLICQYFEESSKLHRYVRLHVTLVPIVQRKLR